MRYKNYIFDLYGTLIDIHTDEKPIALWQDTALYLQQHFGTRTTAANLRRDYLRICAEEEKILAAQNHSQYPEIQIEKVWARLIKAPCTPSKMRDLCVFFRETSRDKLILYPGVLETFQALRDAGARIYLLSNAQRLFTEKELQDTGLVASFDDIFISSDQGIKKPDGAFLTRLLEKHHLDPKECVMVGNEVLADVGVAAAVGIDAIFLNTYSKTKSQIEQDLTACHAVPTQVQLVMDGDIRKILG